MVLRSPQLFLSHSVLPGRDCLSVSLQTADARLALPTSPFALEGRQLAIPGPCMTTCAPNQRLDLFLEWLNANCSLPKATSRGYVNCLHGMQSPRLTLNPVHGKLLKGTAKLATFSESWLNTRVVTSKGNLQDLPIHWPTFVKKISSFVYRRKHFLWQPLQGPENTILFSWNILYLWRSTH